MNTYVMTPQVTPQWCTTVVRVCENAIWVDVSLFHFCKSQSFQAITWRMQRGSEVTGHPKVFVGRVRNQTMCPPVLKCANVIMVIISNSIPHLKETKFNKKEKGTNQALVDIYSWQLNQRHQSFHGTYQETFEVDRRSLDQPVKQSPPSLLIYCYITRVLSKANIGWLPWQICYPISLLITIRQRMANTQKKEWEAKYREQWHTHKSINQ